MGHAKKIFRGTSILVISAVLTALLGYLFRTILARTFTVYEYGLFYAVFSLVTTIIPFKDMGLSMTVTRFIPEFLVKGEKSKIKDSIIFLFFFQTVIYVIGLFVVLNFGSAFSDAYFSDARANSLLVLLIVAFFFSTLGSVFGATFLGYKKLGLLAFFEVFFSAMLVIGFVGLNYFNASVFNAAWAYLIAYISLIAVEFYFFRKFVPDIFTHKIGISKKLLKQLFNFSFFSFSSNILKTIFISAGTILLTIFSTLEHVAFYNIALPTANLARFLLKPIAIVMLPVSSEIKSKNRKLTVLPTLYKYFAIGGIPLVIYSFFFSKPVINLLYGQKYEPAAAILAILVFGYLLLLLIEINHNILLGYNQPKKSTSVFIIMLIINLVLSYLLIPKWNFGGVAIAFTASIMISFVFSFILIKKIVGVLFSVLEYLKILTASALLFLTLIYTADIVQTTNLILQIVIFGASGGIVYLAALFLLKIVTFKELEELFRKFIN